VQPLEQQEKTRPFFVAVSSLFSDVLRGQLLVVLCAYAVSR